MNGPEVKCQWHHVGLHYRARISRKSFRRGTCVKMADGHRLKYHGRWKWTKTRTILKKKNYMFFLLCKCSSYWDPGFPKEVQVVCCVDCWASFTEGFPDWWAGLLASQRQSWAFTQPEESRELSRNIFQFLVLLRKVIIIILNVVYFYLSSLCDLYF